MEQGRGCKSIKVRDLHTQSEKIEKLKGKFTMKPKKMLDSLKKFSFNPYKSLLSVPIGPPVVSRYHCTRLY